MFRLMLVGVVMSLLGIPLFFVLAFYEPFSWITPILWGAIVCFLVLLVLLPRLCWQAFHSCTKIDRALRLVKVQKGKVNKFYDLGDFKKILLQPVAVPRAQQQYHAYLVGEKGQCHLEMVAGSKRVLRDKLQSVAEFLTIPIEEVAAVATFDAVMNR